MVSKINSNEVMIIITNVTSLTSGTLGKEAYPPSEWPNSILRSDSPYPQPGSNTSQTFQLTFKINEFK